MYCTIISVQVRESPDGANSSVAGAATRGSCSRASNATTVANIIDLDEEEGEATATVVQGGQENNDKNNIKVADTKAEEDRKATGKEGVYLDVHSGGKNDSKKVAEVGEESEREKAKRDVMMDFVMMDLGSPSKRRRMPPPWLLGKRRPAVIRRVKKQRSRSLSTEKLNKLSEKSSSPKKRRRVKRSSKADMFRSVERLPTLSPFDEERIVWMRNMEDDIQLEEERRSRCAFRKVEVEGKASPTSSSSSSSANSVLYVQPPPPPAQAKVARKQWDIDNMEKELKVPNNANATPKKTIIKKPSPKRDNIIVKERRNNNNNKIAPTINVECFIVSRGWQLDQSRLLRALDSVDCANFGRVQVATTMSRLVESVRPHLDAVVVHLGSQELMDAAHSLAKKKNNNAGGSSISRASLAESVAASIATVASRQLIKVASQNRDTHFVVSLPLPFPASTSSVGNSYEELRRAFNANLSANCSAAPNLHCSSNESLSTDVKYLSDAAAGPVGGLSASGMRRLSKGWGEQLGRLARAADGRLVFRHVSSSDSGGSASSKDSSGSI